MFFLSFEGKPSDPTQRLLGLPVGRDWYINDVISIYDFGPTTLDTSSNAAPLTAAEG
jgi:hypothetical protein